MDWFEPEAPLALHPVTQLAVWLRDEHIERAIRFKAVARYESVFELLKYGANCNVAGIELEQLAEQFQISRSSLIQGCKELTGYGPIQLLRLQRLERVHQALRQGYRDSRGQGFAVPGVAKPLTPTVVSRVSRLPRGFDPRYDHSSPAWVRVSIQSF